MAPNDSVTCPRCRHDNPLQAKFCMECAASLRRACADCGADLPARAKFCPECARPVDGATARGPAAPAVYTPRHLAERILDSRSALEGERKQVTVLFADLKGSTELLADRDPEEARTILDPVLERMMEAVHLYEGTVNQVMGDGIMALFGAPLAHEDHAVRACYAALRMQEAIRRYTEALRGTHGVEVQIRVGLNSGEVVVRSIGSDLRMDYTAVGQTTHLAARMEQLATPGTVRLTRSTLALAEGWVEAVPLGPVPVKGLTAPVEVWELTGAVAVRSRLQAAGGRGLTRFVGRDAELAALVQAAAEARRGRGQIVAVVGDPGVGKSRLFHEFLHSCQTHGWRTVESGSVSYAKTTPYLPLADLLKTYFGIEPGDEARAVRAKVTGHVLALDQALGEAIPPLLWLLDALGDDSSFLALDPVDRRRRTLAAAKALLLRESHVQPLAVVFEDLHWIDTETQSFLDSFVESLPAAPVLLALNYRPEYRHEWGGKSFYRQLRVDPLPPDGADNLLDALLGPDGTVRPLKPLLVTRTEGNPLFLEESVRALVETGALAGDRGAYRLVKPLDAVAVPPTVQVILGARIDRLAAEDKRLLQAAAVIGKDVPFGLLVAVADAAEDTLRHGLGRLLAAEFLYEARLFPELEYTFKHALTHEVAYAGLLADRKRALHAALVAAIERLYADRLDEHVERLAHHALRADDPDRALAYLRLAGDRAAARSASSEAVALYEQALPLLARQPDTLETRATATDLHLALATERVAIKGTASPDVETSYQQACELAEGLGDPVRLYRALWGLWYVNFGRGDFTPARALGERLLRLAQQESDSGRLLEAHHALWPTLVALGENRAALPHLETGLALYEPGRHAAQAARYGGHDAGTCCRCFLARALWFLGYPDRALAALRDAISLAERLAHPMSLVITLDCAAYLCYQRGDLHDARRFADRMVETSTAQGFGPWADDGRAMRACIGARQGETGALGAVADGLAGRRTSTSALRTVLLLTTLAETCGEIGDVDRGLALLEAIPARHRAIIVAAEAARVHGELRRHLGDREAAEQCFRTAIDLARARSERSFELRAVTSLARCLRDAGGRHEARRIVAEVYGAFTEGFETADLRAARALLEELA